MKDKVLLGIAGLLIAFAVFKPYLETISIPAQNNNFIVVEDISGEQKEKVKNIVNAIKNGSSERYEDGQYLASLYLNLAKLIALDEKDEIIKTTLDIRQANSLSGKLLKLDLEGKYPNLGKLCSDYVVSQIGSDEVNLDSQLREKAVQTFNVLAWAFNEGSR